MNLRKLEQRIELLDELIPKYLAGTDAEREGLRRAVAARRALPDRVRAYAWSVAQRIRSPEDVELLRAGLAAMSIENCAVDYRDTLLALAELWVRAERAGIDPQRHFEAVAAVSDTHVPAGGSTPVSKTLRDFHGYAVLAEPRQKS